MVVNLIQAPALNVYEQMALDELLATKCEGASIRFFTWDTRPQATFGYTQEVISASEEIKSQGIEIFTRRLTGGGIVLHKTDLTFSLIFDLQKRVQPSIIYQGLHLAIKNELIKTQIKANSYNGESDYKPLKDGKSQSCFNNPVSDDLMQGSNKILGGAIRRFDKRILYQGSLQIDKAEDDIYKQALLKGFLCYLQADLGCKQDLSKKFLEEVKILAKQKYQTKEWLNKF